MKAELYPVNLGCCVVLTILRITDIVFTAILLNTGYFYESNPLGFNALSVSLIYWFAPLRVSQKEDL